MNGYGVFDISSIDAQFIRDSSTQFYIRLQNVPRGWVGTYFKNIRRGQPENANTLADALREIELSLKIAVGSRKKLKEENLLEFVADDTLRTNLVHQLKYASLLTLCDTFGIIPIVKRSI